MLLEFEKFIFKIFHLIFWMLLTNRYLINDFTFIFSFFFIYLEFWRKWNEGRKFSSQTFGCGENEGQSSENHNVIAPQGCIMRSIRDGSTRSKFRARGEHGDVFPVLQLRCARILNELNQIFIAYLLSEVENNFFSFRHSYWRHFSWRF